MGSMNIVGAITVGTNLVNLGADGVFLDSMRRDYPVPVGQKWFTGRAEVVGFQSDSNNRYPVAEYRTQVLYRLPDPDDSDTYCSGEMVDDQATLMDRGVLDIPSLAAYVVEILPPRMSIPVSRVGNVIEYEVTTPIVLESV